MAVARFPHGEVNYVMRGYGVSKEKLIGIQNHHHRLWARFAHLDYVKKYNLYIYSLEKGLICTGDTPNYPKELWKEINTRLKIGDKQMDSNCLRITCKSLGAEAFISNKKLSKSKDNSYSHFLKDQISVDPDADFELNLLTFLSPIISEIDVEIVKEYQKGMLSDSIFLEKAIAFQKNKLINSEDTLEQYFVVSNEILDKDSLITKLCANKIDEAFVEDLVSEFSSSLILEQGTLADLTEKLWADYGSVLANKISNNSVNKYNGNNSLEILSPYYLDH